MSFVSFLKFIITGTNTRTLWSEVDFDYFQSNPSCDVTNNFSSISKMGHYSGNGERSLIKNVANLNFGEVVE